MQKEQRLRPHPIFSYCYLLSSLSEIQTDFRIQFHHPYPHHFLRHVQGLRCCSGNRTSRSGTHIPWCAGHPAPHIPRKAAGKDTHFHEGCHPLRWGWCSPLAVHGYLPRAAAHPRRRLHSTRRQRGWLFGRHQHSRHRLSCSCLKIRRQ